MNKFLHLTVSPFTKISLTRWHWITRYDFTFLFNVYLMKDCVRRGQKLMWFSYNFSVLFINFSCRWHSNEEIDLKTLFNAYSYEGCVGMTIRFWYHLALWWEKKETRHFVPSFGKIALSKLLQNVESPFRGAAPLKAHIAP